MRPPTPTGPKHALASRCFPRLDGYSTSPSKGKAQWVAEKQAGQIDGRAAAAGQPSRLGRLLPTRLETNPTAGASLRVGTPEAFGEGAIMRRFLILAGFIVTAPAFAAAQHRGGMVPSGPPVVVAPRAAAGVAPHATVRVAPPTHVAAPTRVGPTSVGVHRNRAGGSVSHTMNGGSSVANLPASSTDFADSPGLGFDFPHLAAISGRQRHERFEGTVPFGFSGFLLSSPGLIVEEAQPAENPQPAPEETTATNAAETENMRGSEGRNFSAMVSAPAPAPAPQHDAPEYVFVRRDGGLVFAVAYSWDNGTLRYITREGLRGSVKQGALDMEATQQFNEQRGVDLRLPA